MPHEIKANVSEKKTRLSKDYVDFPRVQSYRHSPHSVRFDPRIKKSSHRKKVDQILQPAKLIKVKECSELSSWEDRNTAFAESNTGSIVQQYEEHYSQFFGEMDVKGHKVTNKFHTVNRKQKTKRKILNSAESDETCRHCKHKQSVQATPYLQNSEKSKYSEHNQRSQTAKEGGGGGGVGRSAGYNEVLKKQKQILYRSIRQTTKDLNERHFPTAVVKYYNGSSIEGKKKPFLRKSKDVCINYESSTKNGKYVTKIQSNATEMMFYKKLLIGAKQAAFPQYKTGNDNTYQCLNKEIHAIQLSQKSSFRYKNSKSQTVSISLPKSCLKELYETAMSSSAKTKEKSKNEPHEQQQEEQIEKTKSILKHRNKIVSKRRSETPKKHSNTEDYGSAKVSSETKVNEENKNKYKTKSRSSIVSTKTKRRFHSLKKSATTTDLLLFRNLGSDEKTTSPITLQDMLAIHNLFRRIYSHSSNRFMPTWSNILSFFSDTQKKNTFDLTNFDLKSVEHKQCKVNNFAPLESESTDIKLELKPIMTFDNKELLPDAVSVRLSSDGFNKCNQQESSSTAITTSSCHRSKGFHKKEDVKTLEANQIQKDENSLGVLYMNESVKVNVESQVNSESNIYLKNKHNCIPSVSTIVLFHPEIADFSSLDSKGNVNPSCLSVYVSEVIGEANTDGTLSEPSNTQDLNKPSTKSITQATETDIVDSDVVENNSTCTPSLTLPLPLPLPCQTACPDLEPTEIIQISTQSPSLVKKLPDNSKSFTVTASQFCIENKSKSLNKALSVDTENVENVCHVLQEQGALNLPLPQNKQSDEIIKEKDKKKRSLFCVSIHSNLFGSNEANNNIRSEIMVTNIAIPYGTKEVNVELRGATKEKKTHSKSSKKIKLRAKCSKVEISIKEQPSQKYDGDSVKLNFSSVRDSSEMDLNKPNDELDQEQELLTKAEIPIKLLYISCSKKEKKKSTNGKAEKRDRCIPAIGKEMQQDKGLESVQPMKEFDIAYQLNNKSKTKSKVIDPLKEVYTENNIYRNPMSFMLSRKVLHNFRDNALFDDPNEGLEEMHCKPMISSLESFSLDFQTNIIPFDNSFNGTNYSSNFVHHNVSNVSLIDELSVDHSLTEQITEDHHSALAKNKLFTIKKDDEYKKIIDSIIANKLLSRDFLERNIYKWGDFYKNIMTKFDVVIHALDSSESVNNDNTEEDNPEIEDESNEAAELDHFRVTLTALFNETLRKIRSTNTRTILGDEEKFTLYLELINLIIAYQRKKKSVNWKALNKCKPIENDQENVEDPFQNLFSDVFGQLIDTIVLELEYAVLEITLSLLLKSHTSLCANQQRTIESSPMESVTPPDNTYTSAYKINTCWPLETPNYYATRKTSYIEQSTKLFSGIAAFYAEQAAEV